MPYVHMSTFSASPSVSRRTFLAAAVALTTASRLRAASRLQIQSLKDAYKDAFLVGTALDFRSPDEFDATELSIIRSHFNVLTPENSMKPGPIHPQEDTWNWTRADALVDFCSQNDTRVMGH